MNIESRCRALRARTPTVALLLTLLVSPLAVAAGGAPEGAEVRVLMVGDSWAEFMWFDRSLRNVFAAEGHPDLLEEGSVTAVSGTTAAFWASPANLASITSELAAHPTTEVVQITVGGNDLLAGQPGGGWFVGISPEDELALFNRVADDVETVVDHVLDEDPELEVLLSLYDYPNFVESLSGLLGAFCTANWNDLLQPTPEEINGAMTRAIDLVEARVAGRPRVHHVRHLGLMHFVFGYPSMGIPPGDLPPPGDPSLPSPPEAMRFGRSDCIHLNSTGHAAVASNLWSGFYEEFFEVVFADGFESGDLSAWTSSP